MDRTGLQPKTWRRKLAVLAKKQGLTSPLLHGLMKLFSVKIKKEPILGSLSGIKAFLLEEHNSEFNTLIENVVHVEEKQLKRMGVVLQELGLSYAETVEVIHEMSKDANHAQKLWRGEKKSKLIKLALTLITFPEPTPVSETVGAAVLVAGLVQNRVKKATLYVEDVYKTFQDVNKDILKIRNFRT